MREAPLFLAPLRGVTIRPFREAFAHELEAGGFVEAFTPFISACAGVDPLKDRELRGALREAVPVTPQFIGKDPKALRTCLVRVKEAGFVRADLNAGCPFPMVRRKGRGSGLLQTPGVLSEMLATGCDVMGAGNFSVKVRLGVEREDELLALSDVFNAFPLRFVTIHGRTAKDMYAGPLRDEAVRRVCEALRVPVVLNGDLPFPVGEVPSPLRGVPFAGLMVGRSFVRFLGARDGAAEGLLKYLRASQEELCGDAPVLGRMKELLSYWKDLPRWARLWPLVKMARTVDELRLLVRTSRNECRCR